jgi:hypothetical protein
MDGAGFSTGQSLNSEQSLQFTYLRLNPRMCWQFSAIKGAIAGDH